MIEHRSVVVDEGISEGVICKEAEGQDSFGGDGNALS